MYQKIFFVNDEIDFINFKDELNNEYQKCFKVYINFIDKDRLYLIEKDNEYKDLDEALERFFANEEIVSLYSLTFIYNDNQEMIFRKNWKEKTGKELLDDIVSIFDKRKMNRCFNYDNIYNRRTKEEVVEKIENQLFSKWEYNDRALIRKYLRKVIELDQKIYKSERDKILEDLKTFKEEIKQDLLKDGISEEVKEICKKLYFKYDLIEKYDFSLLTAIIPKKLFKERRKLKIGLDKTIENLEKLVLDESYENIYDYARVALKKYLKKYFGKGLTEEKVKTFYKYVEKYDLEEMITEEKSIIISKLSQKISKANWNKGKKMLPLANDKINLIREFITFQSYRNINRERKKLVEFFRTIIKEKKNEKKTLDLKKELLKVFYLDRVDKFFLSCEKELNENLNSKLRLEIDNRSSINKRETLKREYEKEIRYIEDVLTDDLLKEDFKYSDTMPNVIYEILKKEWEDEILKILHDVDSNQTKNLNKLKKISKKVQNEVIKILENNIDVEIDFKRVIDIVYDFSTIIDDIICCCVEYEEMQIKKEIMSNKFIPKEKI